MNQRSPNSPPCGQRSTEWNEEQEELARWRAYKLHKELFNKRRRYKDVHGTSFFRCCVTTGAKTHRKRRDDAYKRQDVHGRQRSLDKKDGIIFFDGCRKKTIRKSSEILDIQTASGVVVSNTEAKVYIKETWRLFLGTFGGRISFSAFVGYTMQRAIFLFRGRQERLSGKLFHPLDLLQPKKPLLKKRSGGQNAGLSRTFHGRIERRR